MSLQRLLIVPTTIAVLQHGRTRSMAGHPELVICSGVKNDKMCPVRPVSSIIFSVICRQILPLLHQLSSVALEYLVDIPDTLDVSLNLAQRLGTAQHRILTTLTFLSSTVEFRAYIAELSCAALRNHGP
jgi:hypothetical protein